MADGVSSWTTLTPHASAMADSLFTSGSYRPAIHSLTVDGATPAARAMRMRTPRAVVNAIRFSRRIWEAVGAGSTVVSLSE